MSNEPIGTASSATEGGPDPAQEAEAQDLIAALLDLAGARSNRDQLTEILTSAVRLAHDQAHRLDLKITNATLKEMTDAFRIFGPYRDNPKVTIFGSARTLPEDPLYIHTRELAQRLAGAGWMVVTGAGPGIMAAGLEGAGRDMAFGINIRLPFEQGANPFIAHDPKLVEMKYFFTRKLMLMKDSGGFVVLPGGFGTLDEAFELLTLLQTGKAEPVPIVLLDLPGGTYWQAWDQFLTEQVASRGLISSLDSCLYRITDDVNEAASEIMGFYRNYHSRRFVGPTLVMRLHHAPSKDELDALNEEFGDLCLSGRIEASAPLGPERRHGDHLDLPRICLAFDPMKPARLRQMIDALNALVPT